MPATAPEFAFASLSQDLSLSPEQLGMKLGLLVGALFSVAALFVYLAIWRGEAKKNRKAEL